jgi:hypothetical protein
VEVGLEMGNKEDDQPNLHPTATFKRAQYVGRFPLLYPWREFSAIQKLSRVRS